MKKTTTKKARGDGFGRIRISDNSLKHMGLGKGDLCLVKLGEGVDEGKLCAAFTAYGELVIRYFHQKSNGDIRLTTGIKGEIPEVFAPKAVMIFGPVVRVLEGVAK